MPVPADLIGEEIDGRQSVSLPRGGRFVTVRVGDRFCSTDRRYRHMILTVTGFTEDGGLTHVRRSSSRRGQAVRTKRLVGREYEAI